MKRILGWAISTIFLVSIVRLDLIPFFLGVSQAVTAFVFVVVALVVVTTFTPALTAFTPTLATTLNIADDAAAVAEELKMDWRKVLAVYALKAAAIFGTLYLVKWWPALLGIVVLGAWLEAIHYRERRQRLVAL